MPRKVTIQDIQELMQELGIALPPDATEQPHRSTEEVLAKFDSICRETYAGVRKVLGEPNDKYTNAGGLFREVIDLMHDSRHGGEIQCFAALVGDTFATYINRRYKDDPQGFLREYINCMDTAMSDARKKLHEFAKAKDRQKDESRAE